MRKTLLVQVIIYSANTLFPIEANDVQESYTRCPKRTGMRSCAPLNATVINGAYNHCIGISGTFYNRPSYCWQRYLV
ncbi:Uncharacterized protein APZ42_034110 [Daphnia magna]|uniref:Uncharacterized protein n=1 Tax=Daphnia magna TaxID=35525 RepID=A0A164KFK8_9CRUS|nr:Uncharacterized protein APZ42_034110 [Daphnia magna]